MSFLDNFLNAENIKTMLPFVALASAKAGEKIDRPIVTRIIEAVIMGVLAGAIGAYGTLIVVENDVKNLKNSMDKFSEQVDKDLQEFKQDIRRLEGFHMGRDR